MKYIPHQFIQKTSMIMIALFALITSSGVVFASDYDRWATHNESEQSAVNHGAMSNILKFMTVGEGNKAQMAYYRMSGEGLDYVIEYRKYLESIPVSLLNKDEQLAYWLNLHNVSVIEMLASNDGYARKVKSLRGLPGKPGDEWAKKRLTVESVSLSLEEIEQHIIVKQWQDPLVIYGLFYGTKGSAALGIEGFNGATVKTQLSAIAADFISDKRNVKIKKDKVQLSSIYAWNKNSLFAGDDNMLITHLQKYADGSAAKKLQNVSVVDDSHKYRWSTNGHRRPRQVAGGASGGGGGYSTGS